jgi:hypothetical protein
MQAASAAPPQLSRTLTRCSCPYTLISSNVPATPTCRFAFRRRRLSHAYTFARGSHEEARALLLPTGEDGKAG